MGAWFFTGCLPAGPVGYGTNCVPNPPCIDQGTAEVSAIRGLVLSLFCRHYQSVRENR